MKSSSTPSSCRADSRSRPFSVKAWKPEYESTSGSIPFDRTIAPLGISRSEWNRAPLVPWMQCVGQAPPNSLQCFVTFGCQSRVKMTGSLRRCNRAIDRFLRALIASPWGTPTPPPGQRRFRQLDADLLAHLSPEAVVGPLPAFEESPGSEPWPSLRCRLDADEDDRPADVMDQSTRGPEGRPTDDLESGILRRGDPR